MRWISTSVRNLLIPELTPEAMGRISANVADANRAIRFSQRSGPPPNFSWRPSSKARSQSRI